MSTEFTNFSQLASAMLQSAEARAVILHAKQRIFQALSTAGFRPGAWKQSSTVDSPSWRAKSEVLHVVDPLSDAAFTAQLRLVLMQAATTTRLQLDCTISREGVFLPLHADEMVYQSWGTLDLEEVATNYLESFRELVSPGGIDDDAFSALADELSCAVAP